MNAIIEDAVKSMTRIAKACSDRENIDGYAYQYGFLESDVLNTLGALQLNKKQLEILKKRTEFNNSYLNGD